MAAYYVSIVLGSNFDEIAVLNLDLWTHRVGRDSPGILQLK